MPPFRPQLAPDLEERNSAPPSPNAQPARHKSPRKQRLHEPAAELTIFIVLLATGLFVIPLLIWAVGRGTLGPYADGGPFALLVDFFNGLKSGSLVYWAVALGPYALVAVLRLGWALMRAADSAD